jgi:hypothetical protein
MNVLITLSTAGASTGPTFNLYSDVDTYATPFETGVAKSALLAGYTSTVVPNAATMIRVQSVGTCTNYGLFAIAGVTTTTTTTSGGGTTTTTTTAGGGTTTTTTTATPTTTTTTTAGGGTTTTTTTVNPGYQVWNLYRSEGAEYPACSTTPASLTIPYNSNYASGVVFKASNGLCYTIANSGFQVSAPTISLSEEFGSCTECSESAPVTTTTTTSTTAAPQQWYQITDCNTLVVKTTSNYNIGSYSLNERVTDFLSNVYTITQLYSSNPGGDNLFIATTGQTGCGPAPTTTTTSTAAPVATNILVQSVDSSAAPQECLGTSYPVTLTTVTATLYNQNGSPMNAASTITVTVNSTYQPCSGGSFSSSHNITISAGTASGSVSWDSSKTVDCGGAGCLLETDIYDCAASNTASLPWRSGTISC